MKRTFESIGAPKISHSFVPVSCENKGEVEESPEGLHVSKRRKVSQGGTVTIKRGRWDKYEHSLFIKGLQIYGRQWKLIAEMVRAPLSFYLHIFERSSLRPSTSTR